MADRDHRLPDAERVAVPELHPRQAPVGVDLQHRDVRAGVRADDPCAVLLLVVQRDRDLGGASDDVVVGEHPAAGRQDHAAAGGLPEAASCGALGKAVVAHELLEPLGHRAGLLHRDVDGGWGHLCCEVGKGGALCQGQAEGLGAGRALGSGVFWGCTPGERDSEQGEARPHQSFRAGPPL